MKLSQKLDPPSVYFTSKTSWYEREQYGKMLRDLIGSQLTQFKREKNRIKKTKISQNIGYLVQVLGSIIKEEKQVDERIARIEEYLGQKLVVKNDYGR